MRNARRPIAPIAPLEPLAGSDVVDEATGSSKAQG